MASSGSAIRSPPRAPRRRADLRKTLGACGAHPPPPVDNAIEPEQRANGRSRHAMLTGTRLGDDAPLPHARGKKTLSDRIVDFMRAGMEQVFAFQENARAAGVFR